MPEKFRIVNEFKTRWEQGGYNDAEEHDENEALEVQPACPEEDIASDASEEEQFPTWKLRPHGETIAIEVEEPANPGVASSSVFGASPGITESSRLSPPVPESVGVASSSVNRSMLETLQGQSSRLSPPVPKSVAIRNMANASPLPKAGTRRTHHVASGLAQLNRELAPKKQPRRESNAYATGSASCLSFQLMEPA
jgi:hypothetical protein